MAAMASRRATRMLCTRLGPPAACHGRLPGHQLERWGERPAPGFEARLFIRGSAMLGLGRVGPAPYRARCRRWHGGRVKTSFIALTATCAPQSARRQLAERRRPLSLVTWRPALCRVAAPSPGGGGLAGIPRRRMLMPSTRPCHARFCLRVGP
ncbi:MAG: hypothetical protein J3K34DRAFT_442352, partial [Monoraphidium minutum]